MVKLAYSARVQAGILRTTQRYRWRNGLAGLKGLRERFIVPSIMKYQVREPLSAVLKEPVGSVAFLSIEPGSIVNVKGDVGAFGFVEVVYEGKSVLVFMRDIELRADRVRYGASKITVTVEPNWRFTWRPRFILKPIHQRSGSSLTMELSVPVLTGRTNFARQTSRRTVHKNGPDN